MGIWASFLNFIPYNIMTPKFKKLKIYKIFNSYS